MKLLIMRFSPTSCHFISLWSKYFPQHKDDAQVIYTPVVNSVRVHPGGRVDCAVLLISVIGEPTLLILYNVRSLMDANCNLLGLQMTPLNLLHSFIYDSTSRYYNLFFTTSSDPLMSCLGAVLGSLLCSFFYLCLSRMLTAV
jgi:hypothetical protein